MRAPTSASTGYRSCGKMGVTIATEYLFHQLVSIALAKVYYYTSFLYSILCISFGIKEGTDSIRVCTTVYAFTQQY